VEFGSDRPNGLEFLPGCVDYHFDQGASAIGDFHQRKIAVRELGGRIEILPCDEYNAISHLERVTRAFVFSLLKLNHLV
jgi:hypothetical protein